MICFRVLYSPSHYRCWNSDPVSNSSHHQPPSAWIATWAATHSKNDPDQNYPLLCQNFGKNVKFTVRARRAFLANPDKDYSQCLHSKDAYEVGELDGVCAFSTPASCLAWISENPKFQQNPNNFDFVAFEGEYVSDAPEDQGVVAKVVERKNGLMKLDDFKRLYPS
jgi:hypothetical protein